MAKVTVVLEDTEVEGHLTISITTEGETDAENGFDKDDMEKNTTAQYFGLCCVAYVQQQYKLATERGAEELENLADNQENGEKDG